MQEQSKTEQKEEFHINPETSAIVIHKKAPTGFTYSGFPV